MKPLAATIRFINSIPVGCASALIFCAIFVLTLMPSSSVPSVRIPYMDKFVHFIMFGALATVFIFDSARYNGHSSWPTYFACAAVSTLMGGVVEILQATLTTDRSAEWADLMADTSGAFIIPLLLHPLIKLCVNEYRLQLETVRNPKKIPNALRRLYHESFPPEERRRWESIEQLVRSNPAFHFTVLKSTNCPIGFITWWNLKHAVYIEHFAISPAMRSKGLGAMTMGRFTALHPNRMVVLEAEPAGSNAMAQRRINFYGRCGFTPHPRFHYLQPPYSPGLPEVELTLLTCGESVSESRLSSIASEIHTKVYQKSPAGADVRQSL